MSSFKQTTLERLTFEGTYLSETQVPLVIDDWTLAFQLGFTGKVFWFLHDRRDSQFKMFKIKKASGGLRVLHNPSGLMRIFSQQLRAKILMPLCNQLGPHVTAYQIGKSPADAARRHLAACTFCEAREQEHSCQVDVSPRDSSYSVTRTGVADCVACQQTPKHVCPRRGVKIHMDLKNFFGSTRRAWIRRYFHEIVGYNHYVSGLLAQLLTVTLVDKAGHKYAGVPQGSKTSGDICNLVADWLIDQAILASLPTWTYSRYADDLYLSHTENLPREEVDRVISEVTRLVTRSGYRVNRKKLHVQRPRWQQRLLGVSLNQKLNIQRQDYRRFRALVHNCHKHGFASQLKRAKRESVLELHQWLVGKISYFKTLNPKKGDELWQVYQLARAKHFVSEGLGAGIPLEKVLA